MMRFVLTAVIWVVFVGGVGLYSRYRELSLQTSRPAVVLEKTGRRIDIEMTLTFTAEPDPFALVAEEEGRSVLSVRLGEKEVINIRDEVSGGEPVMVRDVQGVAAGSNELYIEANPPIEAAERNHAVRVRVFSDGAPIAEETFWSEGGSKVSGSLWFEATSGEDEESHAH